MRAIIKRLFHAHQWQTVRSGQTETYYNGRYDGIEYHYIQQCQECGKMRVYKFRIS